MVKYSVYYRNYEKGYKLIGVFKTLIEARATAVKRLKRQSYYKMCEIKNEKGGFEGYVLKRGHTDTHDDWYVPLNEEFGQYGDTSCKFAWERGSSYELFENGKVGKLIYGAESMYYM